MSRPDARSIVFFSDHLTFIHRSMPAERRKLGLPSLVLAMAKVQERVCEQIFRR